MNKETKFNYGLLFVGLALPIIADYFLGRAWGVIVAIVVLVIGGILLISGHAHREEGVTLSRKKKVGAFATVGALLALAFIGIRAVYAREFAPHREIAQSSRPGVGPGTEQAFARDQTNTTAPQNTMQAPPTAQDNNPAPTSQSPAKAKKKQTHPKTDVHSPPAAALSTPSSAPSPAPQDNTGQVQGGISTGPCSNVQVGGSNNQATTNCDTQPSQIQLIAVYKNKPHTYVQEGQTRTLIQGFESQYKMEVSGPQVPEVEVQVRHPTFIHMDCDRIVNRQGDGTGAAGSGVVSCSVPEVYDRVGLITIFTTTELPEAKDFLEYRCVGASLCSALKPLE